MLAFLGAACRRVRRMIERYLADDCPYQSAAMAYYAFVSLFPGVLLLLWVLGHFVAGPEAQRRTVDLVGWYVPVPRFKEYVAENLRSTVALGGIMGFVGFVGLLWGTKAVFMSLERGLNQVWHLKPRYRSWVSYLRAIGVTLVFGLALFAQFALAAFTQAVLAFEVPVLGFSLNEISFLARVIRWLVSPLVLFVLFTLLYRVLPSRRVPLAAVWPGALLAALAYKFLESGFLLYSGFIAGVSAIYGAASIMLALMLWLYLSANLFFLGAEFICAGVLEEECGEEGPSPGAE